MKTKLMRRSVILAAGMAVAAMPALAQSYQAPPPSDYPDGARQGYDAPPPPGYDQPRGYYDPRDSGGPPPGYDAPDAPPPPPGYNGDRPPPPPPGYQPGEESAAQRDQDARYAAEAEDWARTYCVKAHGNAGAGALIGGVIGALIGSGFGGHGGGAVAGAAVGAVGGAAIAANSDSGATSPGCPPGYVVRGGAPTFVYGGYGTPYYYAAPDWYRPWYFYDGRWLYRPYPYHGWYYRHYYRGPRGYYGGDHWRHRHW